MPSSASPTLALYTLSLHDALPIYVFAHAERMYRDAPRGRLGTFGIFGNHDYGPSWSHPEIAERIGAIVRDHGVHVLRNEVAEVAGRSEEHTSELQSLRHIVCRLLLRRPSRSTLFPYTTLFRSTSLHMRSGCTGTRRAGGSAPSASSAITTTDQAGRIRRSRSALARSSETTACTCCGTK